MFMTGISWPFQNRVISATCWLQVGMAVLALLAMPFDRREVLGLNPWIKPLKFDLSILMMLITSAVFLSGLRGDEGARTWAGSLLALALGVEGLLISLQALRGVRSHMNLSTSFDAQVSMMMGLMAILATLAAVWILGLTLFARSQWPPAVLWGIRLGLVMFLAGSYEGTLMFKHGGHTVGAIDGGQGLPLVNWSRKHGDLRIAHFFALHALQAFPLFGYLCSRSSTSAGVQITAVFVLAALYTIGVWLLFRLAMQGRPLPFSPM